MPKMNGIEATRQIHSGSAPRSPVIGLSLLDYAEAMVEAGCIGLSIEAARY